MSDENIAIVTGDVATQRRNAEKNAFAKLPFGNNKEMYESLEPNTERVGPRQFRTTIQYRLKDYAEIMQLTPVKTLAAIAETEDKAKAELEKQYPYSKDKPVYETFETNIVKLSNGNFLAVCKYSLKKNDVEDNVVKSGTGSYVSSLEKEIENRNADL